MNYLIELIKKEKPEAEKGTIEYVIRYLIKEGHIGYTVQYHFDVFDFYTKSVQHYKEINLDKKCALIDTMDHYKLSKAHLYRIIKSFSNK